MFLRTPLLTEHLWATASVKAMMMTRCFKQAKVLIISLRSLFCSVCVDSCSKFSVRFIVSSLLFQGNYTVLSFNELSIILAFFLFLLCMAVVFFGFSSFYSFVCCFLFVFPCLKFLRKLLQILSCECIILLLLEFSFSGIDRLNVNKFNL